MKQGMSNICGLDYQTMWTKRNNEEISEEEFTLKKICKYLKVEPALLSCQEGFVYPGDRELCLKKDIELLFGILDCVNCIYYEERPTSD